MAEEFHKLFYIGILVPTGVTVLVFIIFLVCWFKCGLRYKRASPQLPAPRTRDSGVYKFDCGEEPDRQTMPRPVTSDTPSKSLKEDVGKGKKNVYVTNKYTTEGEGSEHSHDSAIDITELEMAMGVGPQDNYADTAQLQQSYTENRDSSSLQVAKTTGSSVGWARRSPQEVVMDVSCLPQVHQQRADGTSTPGACVGGRRRWGSERSTCAGSQASWDSHAALLQRGNYPQPAELKGECHPKSRSKIYESTAEIARIMDNCGIKHNHYQRQPVLPHHRTETPAPSRNPFASPSNNPFVSAPQNPPTAAHPSQLAQSGPTVQLSVSGPGCWSGEPEGGQVQFSARTSPPSEVTKGTAGPRPGQYVPAGYHINAAFHSDNGPTLSLPPTPGPFVHHQMGGTDQPAHALCPTVVSTSSPLRQGEGNDMLYRELKGFSSATHQRNSNNHHQTFSTNNNAQNNQTVAWTLNNALNDLDLSTSQV